MLSPFGCKGCSGKGRRFKTRRPGLHRASAAERGRSPSGAQDTKTENLVRRISLKGKWLGRKIRLCTCLLEKKPAACPGGDALCPAITVLVNFSTKEPLRAEWLSSS